MMRIVRAAALLVALLLVCVIGRFSTPTATIAQSAPAKTPVPSTLIFSDEPGPDVPTLQELAGSETTDEAILANVVRYYDANRERLGILWREENPTRLAGIFAMYVTHI